MSLRVKTAKERTYRRGGFVCMTVRIGREFLARTGMCTFVLCVPPSLGVDEIGVGVGVVAIVHVYCR